MAADDSGGWRERALKAEAALRRCEQERQAAQDALAEFDPYDGWESIGIVHKDMNSYEAYRRVDP